MSARKPQPESARRVGDATRQRIDRLADGWKVPDAETGEGAEDGPSRLARGSSPPPLPGAEPARRTRPPPIPDSSQKRPAAEAAPAVAIEAERPRADSGDDTEYAPPPHAAADSDVVVDAGPLGDEPTELVDLGAEVEPPAPANVVEVEIPAARRRPGSRIRRRAAVPRTGGVLGDVRYVVAAVRGVREARRELAEAREVLERERAARDHELLALARRAVGAVELDIDVVARARDRIERLEERRAHHAGRVAAADEERAAIERHRAAEAESIADRRRDLEMDLVEVRTRVGPLERRGAQALQRAADLEVAASALERRIGFEERKLVWIRRPGLCTLIQSNIAAHRADLHELEREQLEVGAELDDVEPAIANLQSARVDLCAKLADLDRDERELGEQTAERLDALRAARRVAERVVAEADREREVLLRELAEELAAERPEELAEELGRVDERELAIATEERRAFECRELIAGVERRALARGAGAMLALAAAASIGVAGALIGC